MKRLILAGVAVSALFAFATGAQAADKPTLAFVTNGSSDFWKAAGAGVAAAEKELPDFKMELEYPAQATVASQQTLMDNLAAAGVKAIMVSAVDPKATNVLDKIAGETAACSPPIPMHPKASVSPISVRPTSSPATRPGRSPRRRCPRAANAWALSVCSMPPTSRSALEGFKEGIKGAEASRWSIPVATAWTRPAPRAMSRTC